MPRWRNGRRAAFRAQCPYGCVGSNPSLGTIQVFDLDFVAKIPDVRVPQLHFADIFSGHPSSIALAKLLAASFCQPGSKCPYMSPVVAMLACPSLLLTRSRLAPL